MRSNRSFKFPDIPPSYLVLIVALALVVMRLFGIDSWTTAAISTIMGYITGKHLEQTRSR